MSDKVKGACCLTTAAMLFALMSVCVRAAGDIHFYQKALFRNGVALIVAVIVLAFQKKSIIVPKDCIKSLGLRTFFGMMGILCNFYAIGKLTVGNANALQKTSPFFSIIVATFVLKEKLDKKQILCVIIAMIGSLFIIVPGITSIGLPLVVGLLSGVGTGSAHVYVRLLKQKNPDVMTTSVIVFWFSLISVAVLLVPCINTWAAMSGRQWMFLLLAGAISAAAQFLMAASYSYASPKDISICDCTQIMFAGVFGLLFFHQMPSGFDIIAYLLIIAASVLIFIHNARQ